MENKALSGITVNSPYWLLQGQRVIRLATIHPGSWVEDVRCELTVWWLDSPERPEYQTLSYVWGSASVTEEIFLNGIPWQVTVNLSCALRYLRHSSHAVVFWIDALCINQQDLEERSVQVPLIKDIYSKAIGLTIFLGNGISHRTPRAFHKTHTPSSASHDFSSGSGIGGHSSDRQVVADFWDSWRTRQQRSNDRSHSAVSVFCLLWSLAHDMSTTQAWPPPELLDPKRERDVRDLFEAVRLMLLSPWWSRVWVVQEVAVAREPVTIRWGDMSAPWDLFVKAAKHPCLLPESKSQSAVAATEQQERQLQPEYTKVLQRFAPTIRNIETLRTRWLDGGGSPMLSLLQEFGYRGATDERDKVYALMGLAKTNHPVAISADYTISVNDVYKQTAISLLKSTQTLAFLSGNQTRKNRRDLPSWVPDWGAIIEPGDRARAAVIDLYQANHQWAHVRATNKCTYWESVAVDLRTLIRTLRLRSESINHKWRDSLPTELFLALGRYRNFIRSLPAPCPGARPILGRIMEDTHALSAIIGSSSALSHDMGSTRSFFRDFNNLNGAFSWLLHLFPWCYPHRAYRGEILPGPGWIDWRLYYFTGTKLDILNMQSLYTDTATAVGDRLVTWDSGSENHALQVVYSWLKIAGTLNSIEHQLIIANALVGGLRAVETEDDESVSYVKLGSQAESEHEKANLVHWFATHLVPAVDRVMEGTPDYRPLSALVLPSRLDNKPPSAMYNPQHFDIAMKLATEGRALFVTATGSVGLGPSSVLPGDEVHILRSGQTHMVLRKTFHSAFKLIGDCYLYPESPETSEGTWKLCWPSYWRDDLLPPGSLRWRPELRRREWVRLV